MLKDKTKEEMTNEDLVAIIVSGDREKEEISDEALAALNELQNELAKRIYKYLIYIFSSKVFSREDLHDFVQSFFENRYQSAIINFDSTRCKFKTLIHKYASTYFIDWLRTGSKKRQNETSLDDAHVIFYYENIHETAIFEETLSFEEGLRYFVNKANQVISSCKYIFSWYCAFDKGVGLFTIFKNNGIEINLNSDWIVSHKISFYTDLCKIIDTTSFTPLTPLNRRTIGPYMSILMERFNENNVKGESFIGDGLPETSEMAKNQIDQWARDARKQFKKRAPDFRKEFTEGY